jgi:hypothetical protein
LHPIRFSGVLGALFVSLALVACGGATASPTPTPTATTTVTTPPTPSPSAEVSDPAPTPGTSVATTGRIEIAEHGFALTLPDGWTRIDLSDGDLEALLAAGLGDIDPSVAEQYGAQIRAMMAAGLALFALGPDAASGQNVSVLAIPSMGLSLDLLEQLNASQVTAIAAGEVQTERVDLPAGEAIHFEYGVAVPSLGTESTIDQYLLIAGDNQLVVTISAASPEEGDAIANSIEVLD